MDSLLRKDKGVTLIELLVALAISSILIGAIYRTFIGQQKTYTVQEQVVDMQQNVRATTNRMMAEIRMAGFGNVSMLLPAPYGSGPGVTIGGKTYNNVVNPDTPGAGAVTILAGMESTTLTATALAGSNNITVDSLTDSRGNTLFDLGDRKYVSIGGLESHTITNIVGKTLTLSGNLIYTQQVDGTRPPVFVFAIRAISYQVDGMLTLLRDENTGAGGQAVADNIENLQFVYLDANGVDTKANPPNIRVVQVTLRARANTSDPEYKTDDGYRKRQIASSIHLKNMGLEI